MSAPDDPADPVRARRARLARQVRATKRVGYLLLVVAMASFAAGVATEFDTWTVTLTVVAIVGATVVLPVPIVLGYGIRAAEREDRARSAPEAPRGGGTPPG